MRTAAIASSSCAIRPLGGGLTEGLIEPSTNGGDIEISCSVLQSITNPKSSRETAQGKASGDDEESGVVLNNGGVGDGREEGVADAAGASLRWHPMPSCVAEWPTPVGCAVLGKPPNRIGKSVPEDRSVMGWLERCQDGLSAVSHLLLCN